MTVRSYRPEIDGLRAIAVISVVLYHAGVPAVDAGFVGVDIFFVISGYLITSLLFQEWRNDGRIDLIAFYARRVRRILPALLLVIAFTLTAAAAHLSAVEGQKQTVAKSAVAALTFVANVYFEFTTRGYFDAPVREVPLLHLWSLSVEEQFYFVWPLLLIVALRLRPDSIRAIMVLLCIASFLLCEHWLATTPSHAFYEMPARCWELGLGASIALLAPRPLPRAIAEVLATAGFALVLLSVLVELPAGHFPGAGALGAVVGTAAIILAIHRSGSLGLVGMVLRSRPAVFFGLISYSLYLWHWPLLAIDRAGRVEPTPPAMRAALIATAVVLAWLSYRFVETPLRRGRLDLPRRRVVATGALMSLVVCIAAGGMGYAARLESKAAGTVAAVAVSDKPRNIAECHFNGGESINDLKPASCNSISGVAPRVVVWGDSHALAWQPFAYDLAEATGSSAASWTLNACPPATGYPGITERADPKGTCRRFNQLVLDRLKSERIDTLILAARWLRYLYDIPESYIETNDVGRPSWRSMAARSLKEGLKATFDEVSPRVGRVLVLGPVPQLRHDVVRCLESGQVKRCILTRDEFDRRARPALAILYAAAAGHPNVTVVDPTEFFCTEIDCPAAKDGYSLYWDNNHLSSTAAHNFARLFASRVEAKPARLPGN